MGTYVPGEAKIKSFAEIRRLMWSLRADGATVILTQGVFDIVHAGHVEYLRASRQLVPPQEDAVLIVGLENDASVRLNKGAKRPVNNLSERLHVLSEFTSVSFVFGYDDSPNYDEPQDFVARYRSLHPAVMTAPAWDAYIGLKQLQASQAGTQLVPVHYHHLNSTTAMLKKIGYE